MTDIALLGLGKMGQAMARRLLAAGHAVTVWNRTPSAAAPLAAHGARIAATPAEAVAGREMVLSMLFDDAAHHDVFFPPDGVPDAPGAIDAIPPGALHLAMSTISVALSDRLAAEHARRGQAYLAAPVFGRPNVAAEGRLWIVTAGADESIARARPVLETLSRGISVVGQRPSQAHALKLAGNFLITMMIQSLSEAVVFAEASGIAPATMLETLNAALFQSPFYAAYSGFLLHPPEHPGATVTLGNKDLTLFLDAARAESIQLSVAEFMADRFAEAIAAGLANTDWACGLLQAAQHAARPQ